MKMTLQPSEIRIPVPWGIIAAKSWGNPHGYPILAVHGRMDNAASFDKLAPLLPAKFLFIAIDLPGHGKSSHFPDGLPYHFMDMVASLKRVVNFFMWESFFYIGHSFGGMIGSFFAGMYPELVKRLVMIDVVKPETHPIDVHPDLCRFSYEMLFEIERKLNKEPSPTYKEDAMIEKLISTRVTTLSLESAHMLLSRSLKKIKNNEGNYSFSMDQKLKASIHVPLSDNQLCEILSNLRCELLIVQSKESTGFFQLGGASAVLDVYRQSCSWFELVVVDGNHNVHMDNPEIVAPVLSGFLIRKRKIWGNPNNETILAVHGLQDNASSFDRLVPLLLKPGLPFCLLAIDLPGHGRSSHFPPGRPIYFMDIVSAVYRVIQWVIREREKKQLLYIGHSFGGQIGLHVAAIFSECITKLVILDTLGPSTIKTFEFFDYFKKVQSRMEAMEKKIKESDMPVYSFDEVLEKVKGRFHGSLTESAAKILLSRNCEPVGEKSFSLTLDQRLKFVVYPPFIRDQQLGLFSRITCPVQLIVAEETRKAGRGYFASRLELYKHCTSTVEMFPVEGNHDVHLEHPERVYPLISQFLFPLKSSL